MKRNSVHIFAKHGKCLLCYVLLCFLAQSCYEDPVVKVPSVDEPEALYPISLSASSSQMLSRAIVSNDDELQTTHLGVFAYKKLADGTKVPVFENTELEWDNTLGWTYSPMRYWDRTASYYFVSYSPWNENVEYDKNEHRLIIKNIPYWQSIDANVVDYVVANDYGQANGHYIDAFGINPVSLDFEHILSQLEVRVVKNAFLMSNYTLSGVSYANVPLNTPEHKAQYDFYSPNGEKFDETGAPMVNTSNMGNLAISSTPIRMSAPQDAPIGNEATEATSLKHLVVPFSSDRGGNEKLQITLAYAINGSEQTPKVVETPLQNLEANQRYVLTLSFESGTEIVPSLTIEPWKDVTVDEPKYNW
ncbi:MAG: fimbrillin family protein [Bacteroidales bacterium]|nr:fimbrillin family protein [Bacteroidales bacterium]